MMDSFKPGTGLVQIINILPAQAHFKIHQNIHEFFGRDRSRFGAEPMFRKTHNMLYHTDLLTKLIEESGGFQKKVLECQRISVIC